VLLAAAPVAYGLDLPRRDEAVDRSPPTVLIVTDPAGNLPAARKEGDEISERLRAKQWNVRRLEGQQATKQALLASLSNVRLLHYAGHGVYKGQDGWESELPLANHTTLTVGDILALRAPPRHVVLSACESGRSFAGVGAESIGIAQALVTAGSESVVATVRRVDDRLAAAVSRGLHERIADHENIDLPAALREVQLSLARAGASDWQAYRVVNR
jgi:CHAT domain-containing protein